MRQCLLFNGWALVSIRHWTSGSHLLSSPPGNQKHWNWALHRTKCGRNTSLDSTDFREGLWQGGGSFCYPKLANSHCAKQKYSTPHFQIFLQDQVQTLACAKLPEGNTVQINTCLFFSVGKHQSIYTKVAFTLLQGERNEVIFKKMKYIPILQTVLKSHCLYQSY